MNDELKRCQSCGSRATIVDYEGASLFGYYIACRNRKCELSKMPDAQNLFRTEAEAIAAWNARADEPVECNNIDGKCSRCGKDLPEPGYTGYEYEGSYCPTCGAKRELQERVDNLTAELYRERKSREYAYNDLNKMYALDGKRVKQINELTAERDELHNKLADALEQVDSLTAELKHKQNVCDVQRDSFLKMEAENAELRRMLADAAEAI